MSFSKRILVLTLLASPAAAQQPFLTFGARALALGGTGVALDDGAASVLDNPAAVPQGKASSAATVGGAGVESGDFLEPLTGLSGRDPSVLAGDVGSALAAAQRIRSLAGPESGLLGRGHRLGLVAVVRGIAVGVTRPAFTGAFARADLARLSAGSDPATSLAGNTSAVAYRGLSLTDYSVSGASELFRGFRIGVALHLLRGIAYSKEESVFTTSVDDTFAMARRGLSGDERGHTAFTWDVGAVWALGPVRLGGVLKAINRPSFPYADGSPDAGDAARLGRQGRVGAAVHVPIAGIVVAADLDVTSNETLVPGLESRLLSGGVEGRLGILSLRGGLGVNLASEEREKVLSAGFGFSAGLVRIDGAAVFQTDDGLGAMVTARAGF